MLIPEMVGALLGRYYFEKRFGILAIEATTTEILQGLRTRNIALSLREQIEVVLEASDLAKFAKWIPSPNEILELNLKSKKIIEDAKPQPVEAENRA